MTDPSFQIVTAPGAVSNDKAATKVFNYLLQYSAFTNRRLNNQELRRLTRSN